MVTKDLGMHFNQLSHILSTIYSELLQKHYFKPWYILHSHHKILHLVTHTLGLRGRKTNANAIWTALDINPRHYAPVCVVEGLELVNGHCNAWPLHDIGFSLSFSLSFHISLPLSKK